MKITIMRLIYRFATCRFVPAWVSVYLYTGLPFGLSLLKFCDDEPGILEAIKPIGNCPECEGFGTHFNGERCEYCKGKGDVWWMDYSVEIPKKNE